MRLRVLPLGAVVLFVAVAQAKRWNTNKDSIIVDAHYAEEEDDHQPHRDVPVEKVECLTEDGQPGECVTMIRCHPILFSEKGQVRNAGLAITYSQTSLDTCTRQNSIAVDLLDRLRTGHNSSSELGNRVVCCARDKIQDGQRSDMNDDLELYTTTLDTVQDAPESSTFVPPFTAEDVETVARTTPFPYQDGVVAFDTSNVEPLAPVVDFEIVLEDSTTVRNIPAEPTQAIPATEMPIPLPESEPLPEVEPEPEAESATFVPFSQADPEVVEPEPAAPTSQTEVPTVQPEVLTVRPEVPTVQPEVPTVRPEVPTVRPEAPTVKPEVTPAEPEVSPAKPVTPQGESQVAPLQPEVPVTPKAEPEAPAVESEVPTAEPEAPAAEPEAPAAEPEAPAAEPEAPAAEPEAPAVEPEAPAAEPEAPTAEPEAPAAEPEAPAAEPKAPAAEPEVPAAEPEVPAAEPEVPLPESTPELKPAIVSSSTTPVSSSSSLPEVISASDSDDLSPQPEPETVNPQLEDVLQQKPPTQACPSTASYRTWPVFYDYPWLATIQTRAKTGPTCSGSLITESHVMTAAHCLHRFNSRDVARMQIRLGFSKRGENDTFNDYMVERKATKIIFHKRFHEQSKMDNNIALIKLDQPVEFTDHIAPIGVFNGLKGFDAGNCSAIEAGWIKFGNRKVTGISGGVIHFVEPPVSNFHLRESLSRVFNTEECAEQLNSQVNDRMLCAKSKLFEEPNVATDFFRWNDGGPLVIQDGSMIQQVGIKSWAYEGQQYPTVYTRVDSYLDWIRDNLRM